MSTATATSTGTRTTSGSHDQVKSVKADTATHLMHCGYRDFESGKIQAKPMLCLGWLYFKNKVSFQEMKDVVMEKVVKQVTRFRAVAVERDGWTYFDTMPIEQLDMDYHFQHLQRKFKSDQEFADYLEQISEEGLDYSKPMWRYILVDELACGRCAVLGFTDHILGDGASQMTGLLHMCENEGHNPVLKKHKGGPKKRVRPFTMYERLSMFTKGFMKPIVEGVLPADTHTKLKLPDGNPFPSGWKFATTRPEDQMDLTMIKEIKNRVGNGCTVNDVLLSLTALAIRNYYLDIEDPIMKTKKDITATYAVNARPRGANYLADEWFGNHIVAATTAYPLHDDRISTLMKFKKSSQSRKMSPDVSVRQFLMESLAKYCPRDKVVNIGIDVNLKFSIMISNVLLSTTPLQLFGQQIDDVQFLAFAPLGCYCGVATYNNKLNCNIVVAKECDANPFDIMPYYNKELQELHKEVMSTSEEEFDKLDRPQRPGIVFYSFFFLFSLWIFSLVTEYDLLSFSPRSNTTLAI